MQVAVNMFSLGNVVLALSAHDQLLARSGDIGDLHGAIVELQCVRWVSFVTGGGRESDLQAGLRIKSSFPYT